MKYLLFVMSIVFSIHTEAAQPKAKVITKPAESQPAAPNPVGASTKLEFEDNVVEGMSRSGSDMAESMERADSADQGHLYKKKADFRSEIRESIQEMGYQP